MEAMASAAPVPSGLEPPSAPPLPLRKSGFAWLFMRPTSGSPSGPSGMLEAGALAPLRPPRAAASAAALSFHMMDTSVMTQATK